MATKTKSQLALLALRDAASGNTTITEAARKWSVHSSYIPLARRLMGQAPQELIKEVECGHITLYELGRRIDAEWAAKSQAIKDRWNTKKRAKTRIKQASSALDSCVNDLAIICPALLTYVTECVAAKEEDRREYLRSLQKSRRFITKTIRHLKKGE